ncbi:MAG TPA: hypothetical protein DEP18_03910 [Flavobacteriales bacterium]|nr:hypothetical protein [Flavobacteriales bacterium]HCA82908.1 hypothetical protein [Flavobacteriales bacterium]HRE76126.1 hypothetical protein [Flavobacteriales bacterium]HRJ36353.1 hypothetical protein [Flavobacteriales bacterium]HRJ38728.1 hypothetical protein [Flavobacteriales bacterium]
MKHSVLIALLAVFTLPAVAQTAQPKKELTCYEAYKKEFDERGAYTVDDGKYTGVIIVVATADGTDCVSGKVQVEGGNVTNIWLQYEDNTFEFLERKYVGNKNPKIVNGITEPLKTTNGETIYVIFVDKIKPKKKQLKKVTGPGNGF